MPPTYTNEDWKSLRSHVERLYLVENRPCKDVQKILANEFQFKATERMFKAKFTKWNFKVKTIRNPEWCWMLNRMRQRKEDEGKSSVFKIAKGGREWVKTERD